jgi:hypothetical protein
MLNFLKDEYFPSKVHKAIYFFFVRLRCKIIDIDFYLNRLDKKRSK